MKIESQAYTRYPMEELRNSREQNELVRKSVAPSGGDAASFTTSISDVQKRKAEANVPLHSTRADALERNSPKALADVLTSEEQAMLKQLFPVGGSKWGVNAYETQGAVTRDAVLGNRLDLTS